MAPTEVINLDSDEEEPLASSRSRNDAAGPGAASGKHSKSVAPTKAANTRQQSSASDVRQASTKRARDVPKTTSSNSPTVPSTLGNGQNRIRESATANPSSSQQSAERQGQMGPKTVSDEDVSKSFVTPRGLTKVDSSCPPKHDETSTGPQSGPPMSSSSSKRVREDDSAEGQTAAKKRRIDMRGLDIRNGGASRSSSVSAPGLHAAKSSVTRAPGQTGMHTERKGAGSSQTIDLTSSPPRSSRRGKPLNGIVDLTQEDETISTSSERTQDARKKKGTGYKAPSGANYLAALTSSIEKTFGSGTSRSVSKPIERGRVLTPHNHSTDGRSRTQRQTAGSPDGKSPPPQPASSNTKRKTSSRTEAEASSPSNAAKQTKSRLTSDLAQPSHQKVRSTVQSPSSDAASARANAQDTFSPRGSTASNTVHQSDNVKRAAGVETLGQICRKEAKPVQDNDQALLDSQLNSPQSQEQGQEGRQREWVRGASDESDDGVLASLRKRRDRARGPSNAPEIDPAASQPTPPTTSASSDEEREKEERRPTEVAHRQPADEGGHRASQKTNDEQVSPSELQRKAGERAGVAAADDLPALQSRHSSIKPSTPRSKRSALPNVPNPANAEDSALEPVDPATPSHRRRGLSSLKPMISGVQPKQLVSAFSLVGTTNGQEVRQYATPDTGPGEALVESAADDEPDRMEVDEADPEDAATPLPEQQPNQPLPQPSLTALGLSKQVERVLGRYLEESRAKDERQNKDWLRQGRESINGLGSQVRANEHGSASAASRSSQDKPVSIFTGMKPMVIRTGKDSTGKPAAVFHNEMMANAGSKAKRPALSVVPTVLHTSDRMPDYAYAVPIKSNFLAPNVTHIHCCPYFGEGYEGDYASSLAEQYDDGILGRNLMLQRLLQAQNLEEHAELALAGLGLTWDDVLRFFLEESPDVGESPDALKALQSRDASCKEEFTRNHPRAETVLKTLRLSNPVKLATAATFCENFQKMTKVSFWHVARRHQFDATAEASTSRESGRGLDELTCRMCLRFDCPYHGEIEEESDGEEEEADEQSVSANNTQEATAKDHESEPEGKTVDEKIIAVDIVAPPNVNHRRRVEFGPPPEHQASREESLSKRPIRSMQYWKTKLSKDVNDLEPFYPCNHAGSCENAKCSCYTNERPCEKSCGCAIACTRRFPGCTCAKKAEAMVCYEDARCLCYALSRECDPDVCGACGVLDVLDPVYRYNDDILVGRCHNAGIQRGVAKHTLLGVSAIHGFGLYAGEHIKQHDFVGEYKGEVITKAEAERRGAIYEHQGLSYLFSLNHTQEVDSTYFGNKVRFINHAASGFNLYPRVFLVNSIHRIALFGDRSIKPGEELLFNYGPKFPDDQLGGNKAAKSAPHVRNSKVLQNEYEVEWDEDEAGNRRARKGEMLSHTKAAPKGSRGGARPGAGRKKGRAIAASPGRVSADCAGGDGTPSSPSEEQEAEREVLADHLEHRFSAEDRLTAYNISDDGPSESQEHEARGGADDEDFDPDESGDEEGDGSEEDADDDDVEDDDLLGRRRRKPGRPRGGRRYRRGM